MLRDDSFVNLLIYVDNMLITTKSMSKIKKLKAQLNSKFKMKYLDVAKKIFDIEVHSN